MVILLLTMSALAACPARDAAPRACLAPAWPTARFEHPVWAGPLAGDAGNLLVVEQRGVIRRLARADGATAVWADLRDRVHSGGGEEGLLSLAFHPRFADGDPRVFVWYTARSPRRTVLSSFRASASGLDPSTEVVLLTVEQPWSNHNGGHVAFGADGLLYVSVGDGGSGGDPHGNGQDTSTLLGSMLRLDVDHPTEGRAYGIPATNPFADGRRGRPEIYAWGLRNPWRFDIADSGAVWVGDVGQNAWEEITVIRGPGENHGWAVREANTCFQADTCQTSGLVEPVHVYGRNGGNSVTGGRLYRGSALPGLVGSYVFADFGSGRVWSVCADGPPGSGHRLLQESGRNVSHFAVDTDRELIVVDWARGGLHRLAPCAE